MPKRYIEAIEAIRVLSEYYHQTDLQKYVLAEVISQVPTANVVSKERYDILLEHANILAEEMRKYQSADMVEVVRCRDCVHYNAGFECLKEGYGIEYPPDYYCADGERKETEDAVH